MAPIDYSGFALPKTPKPKRPEQGMKRTAIKRNATPLKRTPMKQQASVASATVTHDGREILTGAAWEKRRQEVYERDKGICERCGKLVARSNFHVDHRIKRGMGGATRNDALEGNALRLLHPRCHAARHAEEEAPKREKPDEAQP